MQLQDMVKAKVLCENVWCTLCCTEGHHRNGFPALGSYIAKGVPNLFPTRPHIEWCELCRKRGHIPPDFPTLQKY
jgi:hypothetical protein